MKIDLEEMSLNIITNVGTARSMYVEAIQAAKGGDIEQARSLIEEGEKIFVEGHKAHANLVAAEVGKEEMAYLFLVMHAEDQLMSAETLKIIAEEFITLYEAAKSGRLV